jgi:hypothetical protein
VLVEKKAAMLQIRVNNASYWRNAEVVESASRGAGPWYAAQDKLDKAHTPLLLFLDIAEGCM